jgi:hypothetical protein
MVFGTGKAFCKRGWRTVMVKLIFYTARSREIHDKNVFQFFPSVLSYSVITNTYTPKA